MRVTVLRSGGRRHRAVVTRDDGSVLGVEVYGTGDTLPHDLEHWAVERELGVADGFWGMVRAGNADAGAPHDLGAAQDLVQSVADGASGLPPADAARARAALDELRDRWRALPIGARLVLDWPPDT